MVRHTGEYFNDVKVVTVASVLSFQFLTVYSTELDAPYPHRLTCDDNAALRQTIVNVTVA